MCGYADVAKVSNLWLYLFQFSSCVSWQTEVLNFNSLEFKLYVDEVRVLFLFSVCPLSGHQLFFYILFLESLLSLTITCAIVPELIIVTKEGISSHFRETKYPISWALIIAQSTLSVAHFHVRCLTVWTGFGTIICTVCPLSSTAVSVTLSFLMILGSLIF